MLPLKLLIRAAVQLRSLLLAKGVEPDSQEPLLLRRLTDGHRFLTHSIRQLDRARRWRLALMVPGLRERLLGQLNAFQEVAEQLCSHLEHPVPAVPDLSMLVAELRQLDAEFGALRIDLAEKELTATTEPITLQNVYLGEFAIRFHWKRLLTHTGVYCFTIVALNPHPASGDDRVTHPHVKSKILCAGDAAGPLQRALEAGRLADAFCLIRSVLTHYNPASPHVALDDWEGTECNDCGCCIGEDNSEHCCSCENDYCEDCTRTCVSCETVRCLSCLTRCAVCEDVCCRHCLRKSQESGTLCCPDCLPACPVCGAEVRTEQRAPQTRLCPACRNTETPSPDVPNPTTSSPTTTPLSTYLEEDHVETLHPFPPAAL